MQQRRLRLGDILDDYCPRERRITNHAVVAMIEDEVKQTRCTTCDADHEYREAKVPASRRKKTPDVIMEGVEGVSRPSPPMSVRSMSSESDDESSGTDLDAIAGPDIPLPAPEPLEEPPPSEDEGPVHRPLIRATLPRPDGQPIERKAPDFTLRQPGTRGREHDGKRNVHRHGGRRHARPAQGHAGDPPSRFGSPHVSRTGGRPGPNAAQRSGRPSGHGRSERQGSGRGPKRGR
jgi:hypothetical protein